MRTDAHVCGVCYVTHGWVGTLVPAGILLDPSDLATAARGFIAGEEGDKLQAECGRALDILDGMGGA